MDRNRLTVGEGGPFKVLKASNIVIAEAFNSERAQAALNNLRAILVADRQEGSSRVGVLIVPIDFYSWKYRPDVRQLARERITLHCWRDSDTSSAAEEYLSQFERDLFATESAMAKFSAKAELVSDTSI